MIGAVRIAVIANVAYTGHGKFTVYGSVHSEKILSD
jgi:hypothetical protein